MANLDIVTRNFFRMMRSGALNEYVDFEPMSAYKWRQLVEIVLSQDVAGVAARAAKNHQYEQQFNMPADVREKLQEEADKAPRQNISLEFNNNILNKKLQKIHITEQHSESYSQVSLEMFQIIVANCHAILNKGISTRLVIRMGNFLRINGKDVDFQKIALWLKEIQMTKVAQLAGSILISNFAFKPEEVPFVKKLDSKAADTMLECIKQRKQQKMNRGITYFEYAPLENASIIIDRMKDRLEVIEE